jgi:gas vesicle protein
MNRALNFLLGATIGGIIGATAAILLAPYSGEELRAEINIRKDQIRSEVSQAAADRRAELERQLAALKAPPQVDQELSND